LATRAHIFDKFAPKLTDTYHVYGITRRGFGASSTPAGGYGADRLGDDVLEAFDALKLSRPILAGHSIAGQELSSIGSRHPDKVSGLVYLDAAYGYAYYDKARGDLRIDAADLVRKLEQLRQQPPNVKQLVDELLQTTLPQVESDLRELQKDLQTQPTPPAGAPPIPPVMAAIQAGVQKYTTIRAPALAIFAVPHDLRQQVRDEAARTAAEATDGARTEAQAKAFETGVPSARVVRLSHADHYVFNSNEGDVLREMRALH
jgi:non-heme chloroperoxidase